MRTGISTLVAFALLAALAIGQDEKPAVEAKGEANAGTADAKALSAAEIDKLMEQLDANRFSERQAAQQKLAEAGKVALPALEKGAQSVSREVATRSLEVIKNHFSGGDDALKTAAKESLERLAKSQDAALAKRAGEILSPPKPPAQLPPGLPGRIQVVGGVNNVRKVSIKNINGVKEIEAEENGRKVKITDDPANGVKMEVTEKKDGKDVTQKYEAKDAAELKTKHPEAHKLYEEYSKQPGRIQFQGFGVPGGAIPPGFPAIPGAPGGARPVRIKILRPDELKGLQDSVESALKDLSEAAKALKDAKPDSEQFKKAQEQIEAAKKQVEELKAKLGE